MVAHHVQHGTVLAQQPAGVLSNPRDDGRQQRHVERTIVLVQVAQHRVPPHRPVVTVVPLSAVTRRPRDAGTLVDGVAADAVVQHRDSDESIVYAKHDLHGEQDTVEDWRRSTGVTVSFAAAVTAAAATPPSPPAASTTTATPASATTSAPRLVTTLTCRKIQNFPPPRPRGRSCRGASRCGPIRGRSWSAWRGRVPPRRLRRRPRAGTCLLPPPPSCPTCPPQIASSSSRLTPTARRGGRMGSVSVTVICRCGSTTSPRGRGRRGCCLWKRLSQRSAAVVAASQCPRATSLLW